MIPEISTIICTHNPDGERLREVLDALKLQTVGLDSWELIIIDNASANLRLAPSDLAWHPNGRIVREETLGLTAARLRGIAESSGDILVFVDDDNVLKPDYLEQARRIGLEWPILGAWGGGIKPRFSEEPPAWTREFWSMLAIREISSDSWSNFTNRFESVPCGAGLCVRRHIALAYAERVRKDPVRMRLDRIGDELNSCGDSDLALTACDMGLGTGVFTGLQLVHIIPESRLREEYLLKLVENMVRSHVILGSLRGHAPPPERRLTSKIMNRLRLLRADRRTRKFRLAGDRGMLAGRKAVADIGGLYHDV